MCGIVGYIGDKYADSVLWTGLERLQYRGYDSAGMAVISDGELDLRKRAGKLRELDESLRQNPMRGAIGIGHTRWATHGEPNERNAHPHTDEGRTLAVVHNGIIENYLPLKRALQGRGHLFESDTDTEVLAHLVEEAAEEDFVDFLACVNRIVIQACGTSWHAGLIGKYLLEQYAYIHTEVDISSEFRYRNPVLEGDTLVIAISQSGETADTLEGLRKAKSKFMSVLALCNEINSTIAREADAVIELHAGLEIGVASTKAYAAQIAVLGLLAMHLGKLKGVLTPGDIQKFLQTLKKAPSLMEQAIQQQQICTCAEKYSDVGAFMFIGRSYNYPNALEGALKLKEISYIHATGHPAGELKHGPLALINEDVPVVCIATNSSIYSKIASAIQEIRARNGIVIAIASEGNTEIQALAQEVLYVPDIAEELSPLLVAIPLQLLAYYSAVHRRCDVDQPRNLAKSVTVE